MGEHSSGQRRGVGRGHVGVRPTQLSRPRAHLERGKSKRFLGFKQQGKRGMSENIEAVKEAFRKAENVSLLEDHDPPASGSPPRRGGGAASTKKTKDPLLPLGHAGGRFYFLTARDEMAELSAGAMTQRANLVALVAGAPDGIQWLGSIAPPKSRDVGFNAPGVADYLMNACSELPLFNPNMPIRHWGTWRGSESNLIVHLGEEIECPEKEDQRGRLIAGALYPAVPSGVPPADEAATVEDIRWIAERLGRYWNWRGTASASAILIGWIGQAVLGQYPEWRTHLWIKGKHGAGKSTLLRILSSLLGGMSPGVKKSTSAAAMRQTTNRQAITRIFDEAESDGSGLVENVMPLFRMMSDGDGAQMERGTSDHSGVRFALYGAGLMASIIPASMEPQDLSRFVILDLGAREPSSSPEDTAAMLAELETDAEHLGAKVWRRMIDIAPGRWDITFRFYASLLEGMGANSRNSATIGAILSGWDLMLYDKAVIQDEKRRDTERVALARGIAAPLLDAAVVAETESEGEKCLRAILSTMLHKDHGGIVTASELVDRMQDEGGSEPNIYDQRLLGRLGMRLMKGEPGQRELFVANGENQLLNKALGGTRWRGGNHRAALDTLEDIRLSERTVRIKGGGAYRGVYVPARYLPGHKEKAK
ncbi:MAG: hypothetical protein AAGL89_12805 [Pseudomonadota bacterium]